MLVSPCVSLGIGPLRYSCGGEFPGDSVSSSAKPSTQFGVVIVLSWWFFSRGKSCRWCMDINRELPLVVGWANTVKGENDDVEDQDEAVLCLVGKLQSKKSFYKAGIRGAIYRSWHFVRDLEMEEADHDKFIFSFQSSVSMNRVLEEAPWNNRGFPLVLKSWKIGDTINKVDLSSFPSWVQIHGLPMGQTTKAMARAAASKVGEVVEVDFRFSREVWVTQFIRVKVMVLVAQPQCSGGVICVISFLFRNLMGFYSAKKKTLKC